jgi:Spy/CpxP family protein refolding chaperone
MRTPRFRFLTVALLGSAFATLAQAQGGQVRPRQQRAAAAQPAQPPQGPQAGPNRAAGPRQGPGGPGGNAAGMLLRLRTQLELTDDQVKRLEALQSAPKPKGNASDVMRARADLMDAMQGDGNLSNARAALDKIAKLHTDQQIARLKQVQDARAVLTATQKGKLDNMRQQFGRRGGERGMRKQRGMQRRDMRGPGGAGRPGPQGFRRGGMMGPGMGPGMGQGGMGPGSMGPGPQGMRPGMVGPNGPPRIRRDGAVDSLPPAPPVESQR